MEKIDGRSLDKAALEERRRTIIRMKETGKSVSEIVAVTGCSRNVVTPLWNKWIKSRSANKDKTIISVKKRGIKKGGNRTLTMKQEKVIQKIIKDKYPNN